MTKSDLLFDECVMICEMCFDYEYRLIKAAKFILYQNIDLMCLCNDCYDRRRSNNLSIPPDYAEITYDEALVHEVMES